VLCTSFAKTDNGCAIYYDAGIRDSSANELPKLVHIGTISQSSLSDCIQMILKDLERSGDR
jgi:hypothetical protein